MNSIAISSINLSLPRAKQHKRVVTQAMEQPIPKDVPKMETDSLTNGVEEVKENQETASQQDKLQRIAERARKRREAKAAEEAAE